MGPWFDVNDDDLRDAIAAVTAYAEMFEDEQQKLEDLLAEAAQHSRDALAALGRRRPDSQKVLTAFVGTP